MLETTRPTPPDAPARAGRPEPLRAAELDPVLRRALAEDLGLAADGDWSAADALERDLSTASTVPADRRARARLVAKAEGVVCGLDAFARAFELLDPEVRFEARAADGDRVRPGQVLAELEGRARALLTGERTALNLLQRLSGTATATAALVAAAREGAPRARVLDTRKTTPGLRLLERYAVRCGGGENHRFGLDDEVMLKDNHLDLAGGEGLDLGALVERARAAVGQAVRITAEARDLPEAEAALAAGADVLLLDNFRPDELSGVCAALRARAAELGRRVELEASGGIDRTTAAAFAAAGVDRLSVGAPTHSAPALDLSLRLEPVTEAVR
jgi:nicotinate-nucleotide pyrophosphorylase (carboxylating)